MRSSRSSTARVAAGVRQIVVTHPEFPSQSDLDPPTSSALAERGALLERCFTTAAHRQGPVGAGLPASRAVGQSTPCWSSDLGQVFNPPVEDGLALMADRFLAAGFSERGGADDGGTQHAARSGAGA